MDEAGLFHKIPRIDDSRPAELFAREVLADLIRKELLRPEWAERLLSWTHTGFNVHSRVRANLSKLSQRGSLSRRSQKPISYLSEISLWPTGSAPVCI